jgi:hypothetical protein
MLLQFTGKEREEVPTFFSKERETACEEIEIPPGINFRNGTFREVGPLYQKIFCYKAVVLRSFLRLQ